jgi:methylisocitrate lyase
MTIAPVLPPGQRLREAMDRGCVALPGAFNALCGMAISQAGFQGCYVSGAATSVSAGVPDVGILTLDHFSKLIREIADASGLPVIADADTGFGEAEMARRAVIDYSRAGAAGLHLEDQVFPKRCGHLDGKSLVPVDHACEKITAAARAATQLQNGFLVCARTDAKGVEGFDAAVSRAKAYIHAGAEMLFPEGLTSEDEFERFAKAMAGVKTSSGRSRPYLLANMTEFGKTPIIPVSRFGELGYSCVIFPVSLLRVAMGAVTRALTQLQKDGSVAGFIDQMQTRKELYELIGYTPGTEWDYPIR